MERAWSRRSEMLSLQGRRSMVSAGSSESTVPCAVTTSRVRGACATQPPWEGGRFRRAAKARSPVGTCAWRNQQAHTFFSADTCTSPYSQGTSWRVRYLVCLLPTLFGKMARNHRRILNLTFSRSGGRAKRLCLLVPRVRPLPNPEWAACFCELGNGGEPARPDDV